MNRRCFLAAALAAAIPLPALAAKAEQGLFVHAAPRPLPALDIRDNDGRPAGLELYRGRPVLMNLWASWCLPCVAELPALDRLRPVIEPEGVAVVALCLDRSGAIGAVNTFARLGIKNLAVQVDAQRKAGEVLGVPAPSQAAGRWRCCARSRRARSWTQAWRRHWQGRQAIHSWRSRQAIDISGGDVQAAGGARAWAWRDSSPSRRSWALTDKRMVAALSVGRVKCWGGTAPLASCAAWQTRQHSSLGAGASPGKAAWPPPCAWQI